MQLTDSDYYRAAAADIVVERIGIDAVIIADCLTVTGEDFFAAIEGAVFLKDILTKRAFTETPMVDQTGD